MTNSFFMQTIFISLLGHITLFSMFSLSFGPKIPEANFARVCSWGAILRSSDLMNSRNFDIGFKTGGFSGKSELAVLDKVNRENLLAAGDYLKPPVSLAFNQEKIVFTPLETMGRQEKDKVSLTGFTQEFKPIPLMSERKEPAIMFYPRLPYYFTLYFKDRQTVHIELEFQVTSGDKRNSVLVKRRISSGNLEADLLSMRYISRYLFIQQRGFAPNKWQIVKIDLSPKND